MENRYPLFETGRILKKEALEVIRDYPRDLLSILYEGYTDGVIRGLRLSSDHENRNLIIGKGLIKLKGEVYQVNKEIKVVYTHTEQRRYLRLKCNEKKDKDFTVSEIEAFLSDEKENKDGEILLCDFLLKSGFVLRDTYLNFADMRSEYDTIHLINTDYAGYGEKSFNIEVLKAYAKEYLSTKKCEETDRTFCYMVLNSMEGIDRSIIENYIAFKEGKLKVSHLSNKEIYTGLLDILAVAKNTDGSRTTGFSPKKILVD
jgi:hypothetical protein